MPITGERNNRAGRLLLFMSVYGKLARERGYVRAYIFKRMICKLLLLVSTITEQEGWFSL